MVAPTGAWYFTGQYDPMEDDPPPEQADIDNKFEVDSDDESGEPNYSNYRDVPDPQLDEPAGLCIGKSSAQDAGP
jgi:hypothetical protein